MNIIPIIPTNTFKESLKPSTFVYTLIIRYLRSVVSDVAISLRDNRSMTQTFDLLLSRSIFWQIKFWQVDHEWPNVPIFVLYLQYGIT